jgi:hypothetical protein
VGGGAGVMRMWEHGLSNVSQRGSFVTPDSAPDDASNFKKNIEPSAKVANVSDRGADFLRLLGLGRSVFDAYRGAGYGGSKHAAYVLKARLKGQKPPPTVPRFGMKNRASRMREYVISQLGARCACCGEAALPFLTLEHVGQWGKFHRRNGTRRRGATTIYGDVIKSGFDRKLYSVYCMNCNFATRYGATCPHKADETSLRQMP